jgi:MFS family permease
MPALPDPRRKRRNIALLALAQALFMSVQSMATATTPLAGYQLLGADEKWLATFPLFLVHLGLMTTTVPASLLMGRIGRRGGFSIGAVSGIASGLLGCFAMWKQSFQLLAAAAFLQGAAAAFVWYIRFAAADATELADRPKAIAWVLAGGVLAGALGPQTAKWTVDWLAPVTFAGVYLAVSAFSLAVLALVQGLRIPVLSRQERAAGGRPLAVVVRQPAYRAALASSVFGYAVMTLTMSATPLAMQACGFAFTDGASVIQAHVVGMFLPSFFTGHLITRFGVVPIIAVGALLEGGCAIVNLAGIAFANFFIANMLVGLGWNFTYVGGSTLLTTTYTPAERAKVQASHDFLVYTATATAAALSGVLQVEAGWAIVNFAALPLMAVVLATALWLAAQGTRTVVERTE